MILIPLSRRFVRCLIDPPSLRRAFSMGLGISIGVGASFVVAPQLFAQDAAANASLDALGDERARTALRGILEDAAAKGIPTAPLVTKVREGIAKHAEPDRIRSATALLAKRLESAAAALAPSRSTEELAAGADALQAGIGTGTLRDMRRVWPTKPLTVPLGVLAELVASGVPHANATRRVRELLVQGASTTQLAGLGTTVRADIAAGLAPDASMELRSKGVLSLLQQQAELSVAAPPPRPPARRR
jgi:hypothetical protein